MGRRGRFLVFLLLPSCGAPDRVHFRRPRHAAVVFGKGQERHRIPWSWRAPDRTVVPVEIHFLLDSLLDAGLEREEAEGLCLAQRNTLRGYLVVEPDLCRRLFPIPNVRFGPGELRRGLVEGRTVRVTSRDWKGRRMLLLKASLEGVPAGDPELAAAARVGAATPWWDGASDVLDAAFALVVYVPLAALAAVALPFGWAERAE